MGRSIIYLAFANDNDAHLSLLKEESRQLMATLGPLHDKEVIEVHRDESTNVDDLINSFNRFDERLAIFHYGGHAGGGGLRLEEGDAGAGGLAQLLSQQKNLKLVFLNGCSTLPQVDRLMKLGVKAVIATSVPINDAKAKDFSNYFYQALAKKRALKQAFEHAVASLNTKYSGEIKSAIQFRGDFKLSETDKLPWGLYINSDEQEVLEWTLLDQPQEAFNELLTKQLIEALEPYSKPAEKFLAYVNEKAPDWETQTRISDKAKDVISYSFVGVLGIQLRKLMAIGKEDHSETKMRKYTENCLITTKRALQVLSFGMISKLWDYAREKSLKLPEQSKETLKSFFNDGFEMDIRGYLNLLKSIYPAFSEKNLDFPMPELADFGPNLAEESGFSQACARMQEIREALDRSKFNLGTCFDAEAGLTVILTALIFLANYKMVSIKTISYDEMRNSPPRYLHSYAALGIDSKFNVNSERVNYAEEPISTDAILLFKGRYQESVNLFPFIIDMNSLTFEEGAKICFYSSKDIADGSLNYRFQEDNSIDNIVFKDTLKKAEGNMNELMVDAQKRMELKLDTVFTQFEEAKHTILGEGEDEGGGLEELFDE